MKEEWQAGRRKPAPPHQQLRQFLEEFGGSIWLILNLCSPVRLAGRHRIRWPILSGRFFDLGHMDIPGGAY
jgi:hypothetical protein